MDKHTIIADYRGRIKNGSKLVQLQNGWGEYVSCSVAMELVRQAVEEACFLFREEKRHLDNIEKADQVAIRERLLSLPLKDQIIIKHINWPYSSPPSVMLCYLGKQHDRKFTMSDTGLVFKITRIR